MIHGNTVSLCICVRNEEDKIECCLESCAGLVDELVILDNACTDHTIPLALRWAQKHWLPVKVLREPIVYGYPEPHRQKCYDAATGTWLLVLDGDEWLTEDGRRELPELLCGQPNVWLMAFRTVIAGQNYDEFHPRLWARGAVLPHPGTIHTDVVPGPSSYPARSCDPNEFVPLMMQSRDHTEQARRDAERPNRPGVVVDPFDAGLDAWRGML